MAKLVGEVKGSREEASGDRITNREEEEEEEDMAAEMGRRQGRPGAKSNFAVACSLLSQYIKEKGSAAELGLGVAPPSLDAPKGKPEATRPPSTMMFLPGADVSGGEREGEEEAARGNVMELFPQREGFGSSGATSSAAEAKTRCASDVRGAKRAQLTIFYGGKVLVFDSFPADKAKDMMQLASKGSSTMQNPSYVLPSATPAAAFTDHPTGLANQDPSLATDPVSNSAAAHGDLKKSAQSSASDLPIARKSSLRRFLEKRKDRINAKSPYQVAGAPASPAPAKSGEGKSWLGLGQ